MYGPIIEAAERDQGVVTDRLAILLEAVAPEVRDLCRKVAELGKALPEAGFELTSQEGEIVATAELAWSACRVAVLLDHEAEGAPHFETSGGRVFHVGSVLGTLQPLFDQLPDEDSTSTGAKRPL